MTSYYGIFKNKFNKTLVYYPCPKNGNSSVKLFLVKQLKIENNFIFLSDKISESAHKESDFMGKKNLVNFLPSKQPFQKINADIKCCIIRDPVKRFLSAYKNRVLFHKDKEFNGNSIDQILEKLENNLFENKHFLPQSFFLGNDINYYSFYTDLNKIKIFQDKVNDFFGNKIVFPQIQTGGNKFEINLSNLQVNKIKEIYKKDYEMINKKN
ncbi:MAG: hypothetical protein CMI96_00470 [Pelagibacteraceae bacterium]|nr:hypothetical protein [Pelagibacteraceae bacterium]|tara:strand:+ start:3277 stop:3909 length:633 start_codon:yes stop_codon:yes gene_type:complete